MIGTDSGWENGLQIREAMPETVMTRYEELLAELQTVVLSRTKWLDSILPPILFLILNAIVDYQIAIIGSLLVTVVIGTYRLARKEPLRYAFGGAGGVVVAGLLARFVGGAQGYFLPGIISGAITTLVCLISVFARRPMVAWTSFITRRWPLEWYWHPRVRPAYSEVTIAWALFFGSRTLIQYNLFQKQAAGTLGVVQLLTGWPALISLLIISYLYGMWRLHNLQGPSVEEFKAGAEPPWQGQKRGF
jgi:energy-converting hydrogenase Eha subunit A